MSESTPPAGHGDEPMPDGWAELVSAHLDRTIDEQGAVRLDLLVADDPRCARDLARAAFLHDAIARELPAGEVGRSAARPGAIARIGRRVPVAAVLMIAAGLLLWVGLQPQPAAAAEGELARIAAASAPARRVYLIEAGNEPAQRPIGRRKPDLRTPRAKPGIDEAVLHLGGPGCYVLERRGDDGEPVVTGSDGRRSWSVPARGAVRTSMNPSRFRGGLPGEQHELPFVDPADGFGELSRAYDVSLGPVGMADGRTTRSIVAHRRPETPRGPKDVTIEYDAETARVLRMTFDRLPQANGGPRSVTLELVGEHPLDAAFFRHESHHDRGRKVIAED
jgi:hypothetical protein